MDIERALDGRDRLFVQVHANAGERPGMVRRATGRNATHVDLGQARSEGLVGDARKELGVVLETLDVQLLEFGAAYRIDTDRDVLQALAALRRRDDDLFQSRVLGGRGGVGRVRRWQARQDGQRQRRGFHEGPAGPGGAATPQFSLSTPGHFSCSPENRVNAAAQPARKDTTGPAWPEVLPGPLPTQGAQPIVVTKRQDWAPTTARLWAVAARVARLAQPVAADCRAAGTPRALATPGPAPSAPGSPASTSCFACVPCARPGTGMPAPAARPACMPTT